MKLTNGIIALAFDDRHGSLAPVTDLKLGRNHLGNPDDGRRFRLFVPHCYGDSHESGRPGFMFMDGLGRPNGDRLRGVHGPANQTV